MYRIKYRKLENITNKVSGNKEENTLERGLKRKQLNQLIRENEKFVRTDKNLQIKIDKYQRKDIPNLKYEVQKRTGLLSLLEKTVNQINLNFVALEKEKTALSSKNLAELTEIENKYKEVIEQKAAEFSQIFEKQQNAWREKIEELRNMPPEDELINQINNLKHTLSSTEQNLEDKIAKNDNDLILYKQKLQVSFSEYKKKNSTSLEELQSQSKNLESTMAELQNIKTEKNSQLRTLAEEQSELERIVMDKQLQVDKLNAEIEPVENKIKEYQNSFVLLKNDIEGMKIKAIDNEQQYNEVYDTLGEELSRRRRLLNSITELKGCARLFANIIEDEISEKLIVNYSDESIEDMKNHKTYKFTKLIQNFSHQNKDLFKEDLHVYIDFCLKRRENFNLFSVGSSNIPNTFEKLLAFFKNNYFDKFVITLQYVMLSDNADSQDLLSNNKDGGKDVEIKLKIEESTISLGSTLITLDEITDKLQIKKKYSQLNHQNGIGLSKFQFFCLQDIEPIPIDFYFIEIYQPSIYPILKRSTGTESNLNSPLEIVLKKIFHDTKSAFVFQIDHSAEVYDILKLSSHLSFIRNPKGK
ncbi:hypothetical protein B1J92_H00638g [Nakaseomyces glabratus]|nr:hypothetical protein B1J91_H00638g [Nakaseomyces glabratus]OXB47984.1 hypothetical protein B1J92_H00638g [Nakaseomyces glabratus]